MNSEYFTFVEVDGVRLVVADVRHDSMRHAERFERARNTIGFAVCLCGEQPLRVQIRRRFVAGGNAVVDGYFLALWPGERDKHDSSCFFHEASKPGDVIAKLKAPVVEEEDGTFSLKADFTLEQRVVAKRAGVTRKPPAQGKESTKNPGLALISILWFLFEKAGLNGWHPGWTRDWGTVRAHALRVARQNKLNGALISERLYIPRKFHPSQKHLIEDEYRRHFEAFVEQAKKFEAAREDQNPGEKATVSMKLALVVAELSEIRTAKYGMEIRLKHMAQAIYARPSDIDALKSRAPLCFDVEGLPRHNIGIFLVRASAKGYLNLVDGALSLVSRDYVLVDSGYEVQLADALVDANRRFKKPLDVLTELEISEGKTVRPDFILYDCGSKPCFMEVWGMLDEQYETRKREKLELYGRSGFELWQWEAAHGEVLPALPPTSMSPPSKAA